MEAKTKVDILELLKKDVITTSEAIDMLEKLEQEKSPIADGGHMCRIIRCETFEQMVDRYANETLECFDVDAIVKIMQDKKWKYFGSENVVTKDDVVKCIKENIKGAILSMLRNHEKIMNF